VHRRRTWPRGVASVVDSVDVSPDRPVCGRLRHDVKLERGLGLAESSRAGILGRTTRYQPGPLSAADVRSAIRAGPSEHAPVLTGSRSHVGGVTDDHMRGSEQVAAVPRSAHRKGDSAEDWSLVIRRPPADHPASRPWVRVGVCLIDVHFPCPTHAHGTTRSAVRAGVRSSDARTAPSNNAPIIASDHSIGNCLRS
jgi:hypothetical protein